MLRSAKEAEQVGGRNRTFPRAYCSYSFRYGLETHICHNMSLHPSIFFQHRVYTVTAPPNPRLPHFQFRYGPTLWILCQNVCYRISYHLRETAVGSEVGIAVVNNDEAHITWMAWSGSHREGHLANHVIQTRLSSILSSPRRGG